MEGKLIVIEGLDGAGKSTQIGLLKEKFDKAGVKSRYIHFPMLNKGIYGKLIAEFLRGEFGDLEEVHPKLVALLFANDRKEHIWQINQWLEEGCCVLADRYVNSNIAYQCAKTKGTVKKQALKDWILDFEFNTNQLPLPYRSFFLDVPIDYVKRSLKNARHGEDRDYLNGKADIHEASLTFQEKVYEEYKKMISEQDNLYKINCSDHHNSLLKPEIINEMILQNLGVGF